MDIATQIRTRLENSGGLSIQLRPDPAAGTSAGGPQGLDRDRARLAAALRRRAAAGVRGTIETTVTAFRGTTDDAEADACWPRCSSRRAMDLVLLPISQSDE